MSQSLWFALTWIVGTAAILGSFMTVGSLILWFVPAPPRSRQSAAQQAPIAPLWRNRLKLLAFSVAIALAGIGILVVIPFPS